MTPLVVSRPKNRDVRYMSLTSRKKMARLRQELLRKAREKEQFEAALNEKFEEVKADNGMQVGKLENKLEQEKAKTEEAHRLLRENVKLVAHMTSLLKGQGGSVH